MWSSADELFRGAAIILTITGGIVLLRELVSVWRTPDSSAARRWLAIVVLWWSGAVGFMMRGTAAGPPTTGSGQTPVDDELAAGLAGSVVSHILTRRREQMRARRSPDRFTTEESAVMGAIARAGSARTDPAPGVDVTESTDPRIRLVLEAVERTEPRETAPSPVGEWAALLRVYGTPRVETTRGAVVTYRKSRALELTAWLAFNRDRQSRSAARTAIWDIDVSDATFSTVVSDMRRTLSTVDTAMSPSDWLPTTYTDEISLSTQLTTDADLIRRAHATFINSPSVDSELYRALTLVRDVPFAGTRWSWADLDGTTTRLVILVVDASIDAARFAADNGRSDLLEVAVAAGMRVMPGCSELSEIQQSYLSRVSMSR